MSARVEEIRCAGSYDAAKAAFAEFQNMDEEIFTMETVVFVRHMIDTRDQFYANEMNYFDVSKAERSGVYSSLYDVMIHSPFRKDFERDFGDNVVKRMEMLSKTQSADVIPELARKNELGTRYQTVIASCRTEFRGKSMNFYGLQQQMQDPDRTIRKAAFKAFADLYKEASKELNAIYQELLTVITRHGVKLGYQNYIPVGYGILGREYTEEDIKNYRDQVYEYIVPLCAELRKKQAQTLGIDKVCFYDEHFYFPDGAPEFEKDVPTLLKKAQQMYHAVHTEAGEFFDYILQHELYDLETKPGKTTGGYCRWLPSFCTPFVFTNFNGTPEDVQVLTHESGHGFAAYTYTKYGENPIDFLRYAPGATHEIQSQAMEFFCNRHIEYLMDEKSAKKYRYQHMVNALNQLCYECAVDEFQHEVIGNPDGMTPQRMCDIWHSKEQKYVPWRDYDGNAFFEQGGFWMTKMHLFMGPLMYIEYGLAMICAMQYYNMSKTDYEAAWENYYRFCHLGCRLEYRDLLKAGNLQCPFDSGVVKRVVDMIRPDLDLSI